MRRGGRAIQGGGARRRLLVLVAVLFPPLFLGCGGLGIGLGGGTASTGAHTVFLAPEGCSTFLARTLGRDFFLADAVGDAYRPTPGDVLEGPTREGRSVFELYPTGSDFSGTPSGPPTATVPLDVLAIGLPLSEARARLGAACGSAL